MMSRQPNLSTSYDKPKVIIIGVSTLALLIISVFFIFFANQITEEPEPNSTIDLNTLTPRPTQTESIEPTNTPTPRPTIPTPTPLPTLTEEQLTEIVETIEAQSFGEEVPPEALEEIRNFGRGETE